MSYPCSYNNALYAVPCDGCVCQPIPADIYTDLPNGRELRQKNKDRLAELEAQTAERQFRLGVAAEARRAEFPCWCGPDESCSYPRCP